PGPRPPAPGLGLAGLVRAEAELAARLLALARRGGPGPGRVEAWLAADDEARALSDEQYRAVRTAASSGCFVLTGGPGVGKTTATRALVRCLQGLGRSVALAAPTGKAAKRLGEVVGVEAKTLHRLLGAGPHGFRQAARSRIVTNAHRIRRGLGPELARPTALAAGVDCVFVPASGERVVRVAAEWAAVNLPRALGLTPGEVQAVAPLTRVCQTLNSLLQAWLNPPRGQAERPHGALALRVGDRVIQTRNNYQLGVFNGDGGVLVEIGAEALTVDFR